MRKQSFGAEIKKSKPLLRRTVAKIKNKKMAIQAWKV
jgi:hypothetical protein